MKTSRSLSLWILAVFLSLSARGQGVATLSGTVLDVTTSQPIPGVNVYFDNTTIGISTDTTGHYVIDKVPVGQSELIFSFVGYKTVKVPDLKLTSGGEVVVDIKMLPKTMTLAAITITASRRRDWQEQYKKFKRIFLGETPNAAKVEILNPEVLSFEDLDGDLDAMNIRAFASGPIEVNNFSLGYHLSVYLEEFESRGTSYNIVMSTRYDTLSPATRIQEQRWKKNRLDAYKGSQLHLFRSIADGSYEKEGYSIFKGVGQDQDVTFRNPAGLTDLIVDSAKSNLRILKKGIYQIVYYNKVIPPSFGKSPTSYYPVSVIRVEDEFLRLYPNGQVKQPSNYWRSGYLYGMRFGDQLPSDYNAVVEEGQLTLSTRRELASVRGKVTDEDGSPLIDVDVFINKGLSHTTTDAWGQFEMSNLYPGKYPVSFVYEGKQSATRIVDVSVHRNVPLLVTLKKERIAVHTDVKVIKPEEMDAYTARFRNVLFRDIGRWSATIANPQVLQFGRQHKKIKLWTTAPLIVESLQLGYQWTYFINDATLVGRNLDMDGLIKMDTLSPRSEIQRRRWQNVRMDDYQGSWNQLIASLFTGRSEFEGFHFYQRQRDFGKRRPRFSKLMPKDIRPVDPDSILVVANGRTALRVLPGLEVHNDHVTRTQKFYKGLSSQVLRLAADSALVTISRTGSVDTQELGIAGLPEQSVPTVPIDYDFNASKVTNPDVVLYVQEENLKAVKDLLEKVYVHTDKPYYYPGDTIWFKAYLRYANVRYGDSLSTLLYADLLNPDGKLVSTAALKITDGMSWGNISLGSGLAPGDYYLRVYTSWMQNFDEFMIRPLPIIPPGSFVEPGLRDIPLPPVDKVLARVEENEKVHRTHDKIGLSVVVKKEGQPVQSTFSVSVTDLSAVSDLQGVPNIYSLNTPFKGERAEIIRLSNPVERGITLHGKIDWAKEKNEYTVTTVLLNGTAAITNAKGPNFNVTLDFVDTTTALIQCMSKDGVPATIDIAERQPVASYHLPFPLIYGLATDHSFGSQVTRSSEQIKVLREVVVGANHISNTPPAPTTITQASFGLVFKAFQGKDLTTMRQTDNLLNFLAIHVPQFQETNGWIKARKSASPDGVPGQRMFASSNSSFTVQSPFTAENSVIDVPETIYKLYLNGHPISISDISLIPASIVSLIEVYWTPKITKILAIYTEPHFPHTATDYAYYKVRGYDQPAVFREPEEDQIEPDYRATIYWNPNVTTDPNGQASLNFRASDVDGTYKVTVEGVTSDGEFFRATQYLTVSDNK